MTPPITPPLGPPALSGNVPLREVVAVFLRLGLTAFGGPAAHIAMMEEEVVRRRRWLTPEEFLDLVGATNLIPGPNSTEMAIHVGHRVAAWRGLLTAGICFILPATLIVSAIAWAYTTYRTLPEVAGLLYGIKPVIIAVVAQALWHLGKTSVRSSLLAGVGVVSLVLVAVGVHELVVLLSSGVVVAALRGRSSAKAEPVSPCVAPSFGWAAPATAAGGVVAAIPFGLWPLFLVFLKAGGLLFGSGYVLLAFLRADLVERLVWLTEGQLIDAVAVGQVTPGPVFTTATFVGYLLGGPAGAVVATVGIFLPAFVFVALSGPLVPRVRRSATAGALLDGVNVASLSLMAFVTWQLLRTSAVDVVKASLCWATAVLLFRFRVGSTWLIAGGGVTGLLVHLLGRA